MATPLGGDPTVTLSAAFALVSRFRMDALPAALFVTTANPNLGITAIAVGVPAAGKRVVTMPRLLGFKLITATSAQPALVTRAISRCSSMATAPGAEAVPEHAGIATDCTTVKSVTLEATPALLTTSKPKRRGTARNCAGMLISISRLLITVPTPTRVPSRRTCEPASKPEPKSFTPESAVVLVNAACGRTAPGKEGVTTCSMCTRLINWLNLKTLRLLLPELAARAKFFTGSTAKAPASFRVTLVPPLEKVRFFTPVPEVGTIASLSRRTGSSSDL